MAAAGALQPAWPCLPRLGFAHESPVLSHGRHRGHRLPPAATSARHAPTGVTGPDPNPNPDPDGSRRGEAAPADRGRSGVRGCPAGWGRARVPHIPLWGPTWRPQKPFDLGGAVLSTKGGRRIPSFPPVPPSGHPDVPSANTSWCPVVTPLSPVPPAGLTWGRCRRMGTARCGARRLPWSWAHGAAATATRWGLPTTPGSSSGRAGSSTWPPASASSSCWGKLWVSAGCGVGMGWSCPKRLRGLSRPHL